MDNSLSEMAYRRQLKMKWGKNREECDSSANIDPVFTKEEMEVRNVVKVKTKPRKKKKHS